MRIQAHRVEPTEILTSTVDGALGCIGYESRARNFFRSFKGSIHIARALAFSSQQVLDYSENFQFFSEKFKPVPAEINSVESWVRELFAARQTHSQAPATVIIDISSMTRTLIAGCCYHLAKYCIQHSAQVTATFIYSVAEFGAIPASFGPIDFNGPSIAQFAGWSEDPGCPCGLILGIGYEEDLALGVIEELEAARVWAFRPKDHDPRYDEAIDAKNRGLFDEIPPGNVVRYPLLDPYSVFVSLDALISSAKSNYRLIVVPFGPKMFALCSCIAALYHYPNVGIWRVSGGVNLEAVQRTANGTVLAIGVKFG